MSDLINRKTLCDDLGEYKVHPVPLSSDESEVKGYNDGIDLAISVIANFPSAEPERKKGEWLLYESRSDIYDLEGVCTWGKAYRCSECGFIHWVIEDFGIYSFCPNCGADMRGDW